MSNTITAYFKGRIGVAEAVYQNDYGIVMAFDSIDLPAHFDCYFSRLNQEEALPGVGADSRVAIPNSILADPGNVTVHVPLHTGENDSEVEYVVYFKVIGRARPIDDGTPVQMTAIERALALLSQPITNIEEIVNEALSFTGDTFAEMKQELADDFAEYKGDVDDDIADFKTEIRGDIADVEHDFDVLDGQFQTAVAALTVDSEVQGIRTGDDGVTYTTAGEAVRKQFSNVKSDIDEIESTYEKNSNLVPFDGYTENVYLNGETGATFEYTNGLTSDFIEIEASTLYYTGMKSHRIAEYDASKQYLSVYHDFTDGHSSFTTNASAKYVRFSLLNKTQIGYIYISKNEYSTFYRYSAQRLYQSDLFLKNNINGDCISDKTLPSSSLEMFSLLSNNIFNKYESILDNKLLSDTTGLPIDFSSYFCSQFISVQESTQYSTKNVFRVCYYDAFLNFIGFSNSTPFTTPQNTKFLRLTAQTSNRESVQLQVGSSISIEDTYRYSLNGLSVPSASAYITTNIANLLHSGTGINISLIGDSITYGIGVDDRNDCWALRLKAFLEDKYDCTVYNRGESGVASDYLVANINTLVPSGTDITICMIGTNNRVSSTAFNRLYSDLQTIKERCDAVQSKIIFMTPPPASVTDEERENGTFNVRYAHMEDIAHIVCAIAENYNMEYIDNFSAVLNYANLKGVTIDSLLSDGLHPNVLGYDILYKNISENLGLAPKIDGATW